MAWPDVLILLQLGKLWWSPVGDGNGQTVPVTAHFLLSSKKLNSPFGLMRIVEIYIKGMENFLSIGRVMSTILKSAREDLWGLARAGGIQVRGKNGRVQMNMMGLCEG